MQNNALPTDLQRDLDAELEPGEAVLWSEQPDPRRAMRSVGCLVAMGVIWTPLALLWTIGLPLLDARTEHRMSGGGLGPALAFSLLGLPFLLCGIAMILSPIWAARNARRNIYAITDQRAIIMDGPWRRTIKSYYAGDIHQIERIDRRNGTGDIIFDRRIGYAANGSRSATGIGFYGIGDVRGVERLMRETFKRDSVPATGRVR